ncbi:HTH CENPB-type domain-containing protein [Nephila pilipes]|uniref:HTH CENPB-type domain-containing protein n=1 Tax=Nephila pilipes TaxID=299642 RepID=A0A8X6IWN6_NEPPI|nr:HTH CENPB-type domain-containing protein [Nephila pilipes]
MRDKNVPISGPFVIGKTLQFAKGLGCDQFLGSNGWLEKFKKRHRIVAKVQSGEMKDSQLKKKQEITDSALLDDFLFLDSEAETSESLTESDVLNSVINKNSAAMDYNEDDDNAEINKPCLMK